MYYCMEIIYQTTYDVSSTQKFLIHICSLNCSSWKIVVSNCSIMSSCMYLVYILSIFVYLETIVISIVISIVIIRIRFCCSYQSTRIYFHFLFLIYRISTNLSFLPGSGWPLWQIAEPAIFQSSAGSVWGESCSEGLDTDEKCWSKQVFL